MVKSTAKQNNPTNNIIKRIENAKNKEAVINEYRKILNSLDEDYRNWVAENTDDLLTVSMAIEEIKGNTESISSEYDKIEGLIEVLMKNEEAFRSQSMLLEKKGGKFNRLMKLNLSELMSENRDFMLESTLTTGKGTPGRFSAKEGDKNSIISKLSVAISERGDDELVLNTIEVNENIERLQVSILEKDAAKGITALSALLETEAKHPMNFGSFETYGRFRELKLSFFTSIEDGLHVLL